jgi:hypothetical protein
MKRMIALKVGGTVAAVFAAWAVLAIFNMWLLVPLDPALTDGQAIRVRLEYTVMFAVAFFLFVGLSRMAFKKVRSEPDQSFR